uniref:NADH-ubiquinone oxidoreductase chain 1 n=1 Tax=Molannodes epaphos TaxID=2904896 RepID=A0A9E8RT69_9NEOP|nr:NADH dehydrogenase subunit 1 [Molannodes epaphos]UZZ44181.1 NADH dehydrogenase subunit 1 [Molannodes epaphos]
MNYGEFYISLINMIILILMVLVSVAFFTLLERKVLGFIQIRKGPNKVGFIGIIQPFSDAIKLFSKEYLMVSMSNYLYFYFVPLLSLMLGLFVWTIMPYAQILLNFKLTLLFMLCCMSLGVYLIFMAGWSSNSNYAMLGGLRGVAQVISYEVSLFLIFLSVIILVMSYNFLMMSVYQEVIWFLFILFPLSLCLFSSMLAETNRSPFDFAEGESELVSGFNVEYGSGGFAAIFLAEYSMILFMSMLFSLMFLGGNLFSLFFYFKLMVLGFMFIWVRGTLPRYRYDQLMYLVWKKYLPISLNYLIFMFGVMIYICNIFSMK